ncbi:hypothetical protein ERO13_A06G156701v2 [Gossypium hirsutum]|nr:hypothetical protein ERO13_A06G156701v2 [Gossypium hirsutum]
MAEGTTMVLKVDLQCYRCYQKVKKVLCKYPEIRDQKYDEKANTVTITVVSIDPQCIKTKIRSKAGSCIKSIEIKPPEKKAPTETKDKDKPPKKEPETKIVWILCKVCNMWHPEGPCNQTIYIPLPLAKACNENCGKKMCCNGCGGSGCKSCLGHGWISWYCGACSSSKASCKGCGSSSCSGCSNWSSWSCSGCGSSSCRGCCIGCGNKSCGGGCSGSGGYGYGYGYYNSWSCRGCSSTSCGGCKGSFSSLCKGCGSFWCKGCGGGGGSCGCGRCGRCYDGSEHKTSGYCTPM